eukprot:TRINITY_DN13703_c0_g1_i2.p1 TRINITY_DN13703_c0_g1~~TRINITY_DN13703_c0_g1_i2.p1  ORF type:complete len:112 (-),score=33.70 TRINITY_DN13703_c0_g1_i2:2-337(-)
MELKKRKKGSESEEEKEAPQKVKILPLYAMLSTEQQQKIFAPLNDSTRLIVVSTNIAETSLTIPGIRYVVDTGRRKLKDYNCLLYTSDAADDMQCVDLGGRRIIKKKNNKK